MISGTRVPTKRTQTATGRPVSLSVPIGPDGIEPVMGAAYLMTDVAYARIEEASPKRARLVLGLKPGQALKAAELKDRFLGELEAQRLRWAILRENRELREFVAEQAVLLASGRLPEPEPAPAPAPAVEELSAEQRADIDRLIAEVEAEIKEMNERKALPDPKNVQASWEQRREDGDVEAKP